MVVAVGWFQTFTWEMAKLQQKKHFEVDVSGIYQDEKQPI